MTAVTQRLGRLVIYLVLIFFAAYYLMPVYMLVTTSLKPFDKVAQATMWALPSSLYLGNLIKAWPLVSAKLSSLM